MNDANHSPMSSSTSTSLKFREDTYAFALTTRVVAVGVERDGVDYVELASTIAHYAGGGQPSDRGRITSRDNAKTFAFARAEAEKSPSGTRVRHAGAYESGASAFDVGDDVVVTIDRDLRLLHARVHSAGHALDVGMIRIGLGPSAMAPTKGSHGVENAYVEYDGVCPSAHACADVKALMTRLDEEMAKLIAENGSSAAREMSYEDAKAACGGELPSFITPDMTPRVVTIVENTPGCPCAGTHVAKVGEIGAFKVTGVRVKKGVTRISYSIPGMKDWNY